MAWQKKWRVLEYRITQDPVGTALETLCSISSRYGQSGLALPACEECVTLLLVHIKFMHRHRLDYQRVKVAPQDVPSEIVN